MKKTHVCPSCHKRKPIKSFSYNTYQNGKAYPCYCKECRNKIQKSKYKTNIQRYINGVSSQAKNLGISWHLTKEDYDGLIFSPRFRISTRRINYNFGFTPDNVVMYNFIPKRKSD